MILEVIRQELVMAMEDTKVVLLVVAMSNIL